MGCKTSKPINSITEARNSDNEKCSPGMVKSAFIFGDSYVESFPLYVICEEKYDTDWFFATRITTTTYSWDYKPWFWKDPETGQEYFELRFSPVGKVEGVLDLVYFIRILNVKNREKSITEIGFTQMKPGEKEVVLGRRIAPASLFHYGTEFVCRDYKFHLDVGILAKPAS
ncbi:unnamed protein product [Caenorhabditis brenneri]